MECYTGTKECGCMVAVVCEEIDEEELKETLKDYKDLGYKIEKMDIEKARSKLKICTHNLKRKE